MGAVAASSFSDDEIAAAIKKHPRLVRIDPGTVEGEMDLHATYGGAEIKDCFLVRITKANPRSLRVPALHEIGGRTEAIEKKFGLTDPRSLHRNFDGSACVCVRQEERQKYPPGSDLPFFMDHLAHDYLYALAFYERHQEWPWGERSHGGLGVLEYYAEDPMPQARESILEIVPSLAAEDNWEEYDRHIRRPDSNRACLCGSGRAFSICHEAAWRGLLHLREELTRLGIKKGRLFDPMRARL